MRLDQNRAVSMVSRHLKIPAKDIKNLVVFGNHSNTQTPYLDSMKIKGKEFIMDDEFEDFYTNRMKNV